MTWRSLKRAEENIRSRRDGCVNSALMTTTERNRLLRDPSSLHHGNGFLEDWCLHGNSTAGMQISMATVEPWWRADEIKQVQAGLFLMHSTFF